MLVGVQGTQITLADFPDSLHKAEPSEPSSLNERQERVLQLLTSGTLESITNQTYRELTGVGHNTAHQDLNEPVTHSTLITHGAGRGTHYHLSKDGSQNT